LYSAITISNFGKLLNSSLKITHTTDTIYYFEEKDFDRISKLAVI